MSQATSNNMKVGIVGVGNMGGAMALRLLDLKWVVNVHDIDAARAAMLRSPGGHVHGDAASVAAASDVLIVAVVNAAQTADVLFGTGGMAAARTLPHAVMLCPTIAPQDVQALAERLALLGVATLDAPMSGGPVRARDGSMSLMVACSDALFERYRSLLQALSSRVFHVGPRVGDGARTKLVNNLLAAVNLAGAAEAMALAEAVGLDAATTLNVIEQSSGQSWIGSERMRRALAADWQPRAHTTLLQKDSALALAMAAQAGVAVPAVGAQAAALFARACEAGRGAEDDACLWPFLTVSTRTKT